MEGPEHPASQLSRLAPVVPPRPVQGYGPGVRAVIASAAFVVVVAGMKAASTIIVPFLLAVFLAVLSGPPLSGLRRRGFSRGVSLLVVLLLLAVGFLMFGSLILGAINRFAREWPSLYEPRAEQLALQWDSWVEGLISDHSWLQGLQIGDVRSLWEGWTNPDAVMQQVMSAMRTAGGLLSQLLMILVTAMFLVAEASALPDKLRRISPEADRRFAELSKIAEEVNRYMAIKTLTSFVTGCVVALGLWLMGVEFALLWGLLAFLLNYIPNIGSILAGVPPVMMALLQPGGGFGLMLGAATLILITNGVIGYYVEPKWMGRGLGISTLVVFLSLVFWGWVLGPVGMLISVPLTMAFKVALEVTDDTRWMAILMGGEGQSPSATPTNPSRAV
ncbi:MAG: AI-2E family transporter [Planctomyces sp.]|nr:AI-2E family transporter [Planctomyces sp.]